MPLDRPHQSALNELVSNPRPLELSSLAAGLSGQCAGPLRRCYSLCYCKSCLQREDCIS